MFGIFMLPPATAFIILRVSSNCFIRRFTSAIVVPLPLAMRSRRRALMISGCSRSAGVIDETIASAVALRPASSLEHDASGDGLSFAKEPGCFAILTYEPDVAADDPSAYRDVYVGASASMLEGVRKQLDGKGNLYVHADMSYGRPVYVAFFPCDESELLDERARLVKALGADESYNMVASATRLD